jgi:catechol 2,3-dioxygenase-like lactoylglutathione lyase family enzyme
MDWKLEVVALPVGDVDRAKAFYTEQCGFTLDVDFSASETFRVVQLTPPGSACSIVIGEGQSSAEPGSCQGLQLVVDDIEAARAELAGRGVDVTGVTHFEDGVQKDGPGGDWNSFVFFTDPDGNGWTVQQRPSRRP